MITLLIIAIILTVIGIVTIIGMMVVTFMSWVKEKKRLKAA